MDYLTRAPIGVNLDQVDLTPQYDLGAYHWGNNGLYQYVRCEGSIGAGRYVFVDENFDLAIATSSPSIAQAIGVTRVAMTDEQYGWVWRGCGTFEAILANGVSAGVNLTTTGSAGEAGTGGDTIIGLRSVDAGVTDTRVTVFAATIMATNT